MPLPRNKPEGLRDNMTDHIDRKLYNTLVMIEHLMNIINPDHHWKQRLIELINKHNIEASRMGKK